MENKVTKELIESKVKEVTYTKLPSGKCLVCEVILNNGFSVRGEASVVDPANFNEEVGKPMAYQKALDKIWELEGYLLQEKLSETFVKSEISMKDVDIILRELLTSIMDLPDNYSNILDYVFLDIIEAADSKKWHSGHVAIAFRRYIESSKL